MDDNRGVPLIGERQWGALQGTMTPEKTAPPMLETILCPGQTVAERYCVDHLIAAGGMAAIWAGSNLRTGKRVALKVILQSFASTPGAEELFRREALAASRVNHPNVVTIFDVVDHASRTCIVMELLDGEDLGAYFARQGRLNLEEAVALLLPAMRGVAAANAQGVVHRDLKPRNIFLCIGPDGRLVTTKILDFGISLIADKAGQQDSDTVQLPIHGTPAYMSPEHIAGAANIDERADVYGFGVILFEALAGRPPFVGPPGSELLMRILEEPLPKLTLFRPDLSPRMEAIIEQAMAKEPDHRFPTLNHFIAALEDHVMPRSPILRSLTPMGGVPLLDSRSGPSGLADSVVQVVRRSELSGEHDGGATRALYGLSHTSAPKDERQSQPLVSLRPTSDALLLSSGEVDSGPLVLAAPRTAWRRVAIPALAAVISVLVAWLLFPSRPNYPERKRQAAAVAVPAAPVSVPLVTDPTSIGHAQPFAPPRVAPEPSVEAVPSTLEALTTDGRSLSHARVGAKNRSPHAAAQPTVQRWAGNQDQAADPAQEHVAEPAPGATPSSLSPPPARPPEGITHRSGQLSNDDF